MPQGHQKQVNQDVQNPFLFYSASSVSSALTQNPPFLSSCRIFSSVFKEQGKDITVTGPGFKESFVSAQHDFFEITWVFPGV